MDFLKLTAEENIGYEVCQTADEETETEHEEQHLGGGERVHHDQHTEQRDDDGDDQHTFGGVVAEFFEVDDVLDAFEPLVGDHKAEDERDQCNHNRTLEPEENPKDHEADTGGETVGVIHDAAFHLGHAVADQLQHAEHDDADCQHGADDVLDCLRPEHERQTEENINKRSNEFHHIGFFHFCFPFYGPRRACADFRQRRRRLRFGNRYIKNIIPADTKKCNAQSKQSAAILQYRPDAPGACRQQDILI